VPEGEPVIVPFSCPDLAGDGAHHVVTVVDTGFDLSLPGFQDKMAGCYTITCAQSSAALPATFAEAKAQFLQTAAVKDTSCHLAPSLALRKSSRLAQLASSRDKWNSGIIAHTPDKNLAESTIPILEGEQTFNYHGTATASLVAYENPDVRIVFVERNLAHLGSGPTCMTAAELDLRTALYNDPDIRAAVATAPASALEEEMAAMYRHHGVTLQSESFGPWSLAKLQSACPDVADRYAKYAAAYADYAGAREKAINPIVYAGTALLNVRSAGNDGATLSSMADYVDCPTDPRNVPLGEGSVDLIVGSWMYNYGSVFVSPFSNQGPCVQTYAAGSDVVTLFPDRFLAVMSGTSISAPLVVRHLSLTTKPNTTPAEMRDALLVNPMAPIAWFPEELLYDTATPGAPIAF
jgi:hypothetical protein